jgi:hypothetical protein
MDRRQYLTGTEENTKGINRTLGTAVWPRDNKIAGLPGSEIQSVVSVVRKATLAGDWSPKDRQPAEPCLASIHTFKNVESTSRQIRDFKISYIYGLF